MKKNLNLLSSLNVLVSIPVVTISCGLQPKESDSAYDMKDIGFSLV